MKPERLFADANLFLRYLTNDVPEQADAVEQLLRRAGSDGPVLVTNTLVMAEIVWTLDTFYHLPRNDIKEKLPGCSSPRAMTSASPGPRSTTAGMSARD